jgi:hypothetical protein
MPTDVLERRLPERNYEFSLYVMILAVASQRAGDHEAPANRS